MRFSDYLQTVFDKFVIDSQLLTVTIEQAKKKFEGLRVG